MKIAEIRALSDAELVVQSKEAQQEKFNLRRQQSTGQIEKPSRLRDLRKTRAKIATVLSERRLGLKVTSRPVAKKENKSTKKQ
jgi:large subunit ribosomal protein L29